jgi:hypothetical protein
LIGLQIHSKTIRGIIVVACAIRNGIALYHGDICMKAGLASAVRLRSIAYAAGSELPTERCKRRASIVLAVQQALIRNVTAVCQCLSHRYRMTGNVLIFVTSHLDERKGREEVTSTLQPAIISMLTVISSLFSAFTNETTLIAFDCLLL